MERSRPGRWAGFAAAALACGAGLGCASSTTSVPPGLPQAATVIEAENFKTSFTTFRVPGYRISNLKRGKKSPEASAVALAGYRLGLGFDWRRPPSGFSYKLEKDGASAPASDVACLWGRATTANGFATKAYGSAFHVPEGSVLVCEVRLAPGAEPWKLLVWTGPPANAVSAGFPGGGLLSSGDVRYEVVSTNLLDPGGRAMPTLTATSFVREGKAVAAVDRTAPGRVLLGPSVQLFDQPLFAAVGTAILLGDWEETLGEWGGSPP